MEEIPDTFFGDSDLGRNARAFFDAHIAANLTLADVGKYLIIDTNTKNYVLDRDDYRASVEAVQQNPGGRNRFCVRVGYRSAGSIHVGASVSPRTDWA